MLCLVSFLNVIIHTIFYASDNEIHCHGKEDEDMGNECCYLELVVYGVLFCFEWELINKEIILKKSTSVAAHVW